MKNTYNISLENNRKYRLYCEEMPLTIFNHISYEKVWLKYLF